MKSSDLEDEAPPEVELDFAIRSLSPQCMTAPGSWSFHRRRQRVCRTDERWRGTQRYGYHL